MTEYIEEAEKKFKEIIRLLENIDTEYRKAVGIAEGVIAHYPYPSPPSQLAAEVRGGAFQDAQGVYRAGILLLQQYTKDLVSWIKTSIEERGLDYD